MAYHTILYLFLFLPAVLLAYQAVPAAKRWMVLLVSGYIFFWSFSGKLVLYLMGTTLLVHYGGIWMEHLKLQCREKIRQVPREERKAVKEQYKKKERQVLTGAVLVLLAVLGYLKYYNFFAQNVNWLMGHWGKGTLLNVQVLVLPVGISFYTLQAIGYLADVYWEKIPAEKHLGKLGLFLCFFPQIMEGPISMYSQTADPLWKGASLKEENLAAGSMRILWGLFKKLVVADRLYVLVKAVFSHYEGYSGVTVAAAAIAYTIQLYMEFSGCMDIVIGSGRLFGVKLPENFRQPFASKSASEFWRRWHITLGVWFRTYVFYPVSMSAAVKKWNKFAKKRLGRYAARMGVTAAALFPVWLCNGLWHGPRWNYIFYGMYYFVLLVLEAALEPLWSKVIQVCHIREEALYWKLPRILKTWVIIFVGELFFRAEGLRIGLHMFCSMFRDFHLERLWDGSFLNFGLDRGDYAVAAAGCLAAAVVGMCRERNLFNEAAFLRLWTPVRWAVYYALIFGVVIFGAYGIGYQQVDLIYAGF